MIRINFGCGTNKLNNCLNVDCNKEVEPDLVHDLIKFPYPFDPDHVDEIYFFHTIEHIEKKYHGLILEEFYRILKPGGALIISYPEFEKVAINWIENKNGGRAFWEATIYGRQLTNSDFHVAAMYTPEVIQLMVTVGFKILRYCSEPNQDFNTIIWGIKGEKGLTREEGVRKEIWGY